MAHEERRGDWLNDVDHSGEAGDSVWEIELCGGQASWHHIAARSLFTTMLDCGRRHHQGRTPRTVGTQTRDLMLYVSHV